MTGGRRAVFLDRDGVLNKLVSRDGGFYSPRRAADFELFPWTVESLRILHENGWLLVVVTNQPDIARGHMSIDELQSMHDVLRAATPVDSIRVCPHDGTASCTCRKPQPGLFLRAIDELGIDESTSWTIGDRASDIAAGLAVGTRVIHVASGQEEPPNDDRIVRATNLLDAVRHILS